MNQPLGAAVGNSLEMIEAIETLRGGGPADFREHCLHVAAHVLLLGQRAKDLDEARALAEKSIADGSALEKLRVLVQAQGGDVSYVDDVSKFEAGKICGSGECSSKRIHLPGPCQKRGRSGGRAWRGTCQKRRSC
jgi:pyrimidine-nucleoside phosphorylase